MVNNTVTVKIIDYSEKLGLYKVELEVNNEYVAMSTGNNVVIAESKIGKLKCMVSIHDEWGIGTAFFHCDTVEDKRKVKIAQCNILNKEN